MENREMVEAVKIALSEREKEKEFCIIERIGFAISVGLFLWVWL